MRAMFNSSELNDELQTLKSEVMSLLNDKVEGVFDAASNRADAFAGQIKAALNELGETLSEQEDHVETTIAEHPIETMDAVPVFRNSSLSPRQRSAHAAGALLTVIVRSLNKSRTPTAAAAAEHN